MQMHSQKFIFVKPVNSVEIPSTAHTRRSKLQKGFDSFPWVCTVVLLLILISCFSAWLWIADAGLANVAQANLPPEASHPFGTDTLGRDILGMTLAGGRSSLIIGIVSALISTAIAICYGCLCAMSPAKAAALLLRSCDILISIPSFLLVVFIQAMLGQASVVSLAFVIGLTGWMGMAKVVYSEALHLKQSDMVQASRAMGAGFLHILRFHLLPNLFPAILFMSASSVAAAIGIESTMSFLGIGLPVEMLSWGSILSLAQNSILSGRWWCFLFPGLFLATTLLCVTRLASYVQQCNNHRCSNL